jgi:hydroxypyruvate reductase
VTEERGAGLRGEAAAIFRAAVAAVEPSHLVAQALHVDGKTVCAATAAGGVLRWKPPTLIVGAGKGSARMAKGAEAVLGDLPSSGEVIVADGCGAELSSVEFCEAGHPVPDERGERAARRLLQKVVEHGQGGILALISGGASSLMVAPRPPVSLTDKRLTTELLLACGADIHEVNTVRKHLSEVKGGGLLRRARVPMATFLLSDVVGDDPATIGSGPTVADPTTYADVWKIMERYGIASRLPRSVADLLRQGLAGKIPETLKNHEAAAALGEHVVIGCNRTALQGGQREAQQRGWSVAVREEPLTGDTNDAARGFAAWVLQESQQKTKAPVCLLAGGETTVHVRGSGSGGRNQEFALVMAETLSGANALVLSAGTDGIDGPTAAAGAFVDGTTLRRARAAGEDLRAALADNDSNSFFGRIGDLFQCGPTGTNVTDIKIALLPGDA